MTSKTSTKTAKPAPGATPVKTTKAVAAPKKTLAPGKAAKPAQPALAKPFTSEQIIEMFKLVKGATSVELKLSLPLTRARAAVKSIGFDPVEAQPRQAFFFDTPDLASVSYTHLDVYKRQPRVRVFSRCHRMCL